MPNSGFVAIAAGESHSLAIRVPVPQCVPADINCNGIVNVDDLLFLISTWGQCPTPPLPCAADIAPLPSGNGVVNVDDLLMVISNWG